MIPCNYAETMPDDEFSSGLPVRQAAGGLPAN